MGGSAQSPLVTDAAVTRLDVYDATAHCAGNGIAAGAGAAVLSHTYSRGQAVTLDVPPGPHTFVLTTYADDAATVILGIACTEATVQAGAQLCFDVTLQPAPDAGVDLSACGPGNPACQCMTDSDCTTDPGLPRCGPAGHCVACLPTNDNCSFDHYCDSNTLTCSGGCKSNQECAALAAGDGGVGPADTLCDLTRHTCVECITNNDCPSDKLCSSAGTCVPGCDVAAGKLCPGSLTCCNKQCVDTTTDPFNCNGCGNVCSGGATLCCAGACKNPQMDADNCGGCGNACSSNHMATRTCSGGACNGTCAPSYGDCDGNKLTNGCETDLTSTSAHCGMCNINCATQVVNANGAFCTSSSCDYTTCINTNFGDCDGSRANGCETDLRSSTTSCGACGTNCNTQVSNASGVFCNARSCDYAACNSGFGDCNAVRADGCERDTTTTTNCGGCNVACDTTTGTPSCVLVGTGPQRTCSYVCTSPLADCVSAAPDTNGCETNKSTDPMNCGGCGMACSTNHMLSVQCSGGNCTGSCSGFFADCNGDLRTDGCERAIDTTTDCSACNIACNSGTNNTARSCNGTTCSYTCAANQVDCDGDINPDSNGCECAGSGCCTSGTPSTYGSCQTTHSDGLGQSFWDCLPLNTYTVSQAQAAARAYDSGGAVDGTNNHYVNPKNAADTVDYICNSSTTKNSCPCWAWNATGAYAGALGTVDLHTPSSTTNCYFPLGSGFPGWD